MSEPAAGPPPSQRRAGRLNFTLLQFLLFGGAGVLGMAALLAAGLAFGLALAGAALIAVLVLAIWFVAANLVGPERVHLRRPPTS